MVLPVRMSSPATGPSSSASKARRCHEAESLPSDREIKEAKLSAIRAWCQKLGVDGHQKKTTVDDLRRLLQAFCDSRRPTEDANPQSTDPSENEQLIEPVGDISPVDLALRGLLKATTEVKKAQTALNQKDGDAATPLNAAAHMLEGLIGGLRLALLAHPPPKIVEDRVQIPPDRRKTYRDAARRSPWDVPPTRRQTPEPIKQARTEAKKLLAPPQAEPSRSAIWVPECDGFRRMEISIIQFEREITAAIAARLPANMKSRKHVEFLRRQERGGFQIQLAEHAWEYLHESGNMTLITASKGTWKKLDLPSGPPGPSLVIQAVDKSISEAEIKEELAHRNAELHGLETSVAFDSILQVSRLKWRNPATGELEKSRSVRVHLKPILHDAIYKQGTVAMGYRLCHVRPYEPLKKRCLNCGRLGFHTINECRFDPRCRHCHGGHRSDACDQKPKKPDLGSSQLQKVGPTDWADDSEEEERTHKISSSRLV